MTFGSTILSLALSLFLCLARAFPVVSGVAARLILTTPDRGSALLVSSASETHKTGTTRGKVQRGKGGCCPSIRGGHENVAKGGKEREGGKTGDLVRSLQGSSK